MKNMTGFDQKGFTLPELMVCVAIFPAIFLSMYMVLSASNQVFRTNDIYSQLNGGAMQTLRFINREIGQTSPNTTPTHLSITNSGGNSIVRFQIPVDWDNDGDADTGGLNPQAEWGIYDQGFEFQDGRLGGWARYSVVNNQLIREVLDSAQTPITDLQRVVANNVQSFTVTQSQKTITMTLVLQKSDTIGKKGANTRNIQSTFTTSTLLRNAVN